MPLTLAAHASPWPAVNGFSEGQYMLTAVAENSIMGETQAPNVGRVAALCGCRMAGMTGTTPAAAAAKHVLPSAAALH